VGTGALSTAATSAALSAAPKAAAWLACAGPTPPALGVMAGPAPTFKFMLGITSM
jgi:hypothetical protein